ncbi:MAG: histidine phosphatase family protein [Erysipelothrix sp.]
MKLVLVRHGFSVANGKNIYSGWSDVALSEKGIEELKEYRDSYDYPRTDRYYSSDLMRCQDTFKYLFGGKVELDEISPRLREIYFGSYEDQVASEVPVPFMDEFFLNESSTGGETFSSFSYRIMSELNRIVGDLKDQGLDSATLVCHSGVIKCLLIQLQNLPFSDFKTLEAPNGLGFVLEIEYDEKYKFIECKSVTPIKKI